MEFLSDLNEAQRKAVEHAEGPLMVIAGAGSGKTRVLTYRIAHLINLGIDPFNILALTFTNKAAREMKERITKIVGPDARNLWMGTFHSVFARILRAEAEKLGYPSNFTIYDTDDSKSLIKTILKEEGLDDKKYKPGFVLSRISSAKNSLISVREYQNNTTIQSDDRSSGKPKLGIIYEKYVRRCRKAGAMDFDDILYNTNVLLRDFPDAMYKYQHRFKFILVDEYQDTNYAQYLIVKKLAAVHENICVVGDDAQSIYAFRGANIQNILNFEKDYPDVQVFKLEQNYRSTQNIVDAANSIIANNRDQIRKKVWTSNDSGNKIRVLRSNTDNEEGTIVAENIFNIKMNQQALNKDFAILYRTNAQSRAMEEALRRMNIPYRIYGGLSFYKRKEIKDLLAYFRLIINPLDEEALKRIINYPTRGIGNTTMDRIIKAANDHEKSIWEILDSPDSFHVKINTGTYNKIREFTDMIKRFRSSLRKQNAYELASEIATGTALLKELYSDKTPEGVSRYENIQELLNGVKEFTEQERNSETEPIVENLPEFRTLDEFMQDIALLTTDDIDDDDDDKVSLMTVHSAKGLEFPYVFIVGLEENLFPSQLSLNSRAELEEERRLFYVALTRAMKEVTITYSISRYRWGNLIMCEPSRFIEEIEMQYLEYTEPQRKAARQSDKINQIISPVAKQRLIKMQQAAAKEQSTFRGDDTSNLQVGMEVEHQRFGSGKVVSVEGIHPNQKAVVFFQGVGQKQLLLKYAKLKVLN